MLKRISDFFLQERIPDKIVTGEVVSWGFSVIWSMIKDEVIHFGFVMLIGLLYPFAAYFGKKLLTRGLKILSRFFPGVAENATEQMQNKVNGHEPPAE
jgi:hypothetical protein